MRRIIVCFLVAVLLALPAGAVDVAQAQADQFGLDGLEDAVPEGARQWMDELDPAVQTDFGAAVGEIFQDAVAQSGPIWRSAFGLMLRVLLIVVLCQMVEALGEVQGSQAVALAGALAVTACCAADVSALVGLGRETLEEISAFSTLLMPVMAAAAAASGGTVSAGGLYAVTVVFSNLLIRLSTALFLPMIYADLALAMVDVALQQERLQGLRQCLAWVIRNGLKGVMYAYTGFMAVTGVLSGSADAAALKAAQMTISTVVPVVGGIISSAAETVLSSAGLLRSAAGTFGMLAVLGAFVTPFLQIGISYLAFKVTAALSAVLGSGQGRLLEALTGAAGNLLAMVGSATVMSLLACCCFMKVVTP